MYTLGFERFAGPEADRPGAALRGANLSGADLRETALGIADLTDG